VGTLSWRREDRCLTRNHIAAADVQIPGVMERTEAARNPSAHTDPYRSRYRRVNSWAGRAGGIGTCNCTHAAADEGALSDQFGDDLHAQREMCGGPVDELAGVAAVGPDQSDAREARVERPEH
jgi:hypothetical protein